jgi:hypothetical protein
MAGEVTVPMLPCRTLEESVPFYEALGFACTYRQRRPIPHAVVERGDIGLHLYGLPDLDPEETHSTALIVVPDLPTFHDELAEGLTAAYGKVPRSGFPRVTRPRRRHGTVGGFSVVDPAGCWLRISQLGDTEEAANAEPTTGLRRAIEVAARLGDAKGDVPAARHHLLAAIDRHPDASAEERADAAAYLAELDEREPDRDQPA